mmetsp:Transcript_3967/g.6999  ORF Transcript_3967/g.6999 Transcript_3967/m.6999 type:complete len:205 (-) Transcript_3967:1182-1796(-)
MYPQCSRALLHCIPVLFKGHEAGGAIAVQHSMKSASGVGTLGRGVWPYVRRRRLHLGVDQQAPRVLRRRAQVLASAEQVIASFLCGHGPLQPVLLHRQPGILLLLKVAGRGNGFQGLEGSGSLTIPLLEPERSQVHGKDFQGKAERRIGRLLTAQHLRCASQLLSVGRVEEVGPQVLCEGHTGEWVVGRQVFHEHAIELDEIGR